jgi:hypothetical protein
MRDQIRKFSAVSVMACSIACSGGGAPTSPSPTAAAPPAQPAPVTPATLTLAVELSPAAGASALTERRGNNRQQRRFRAKATATARNGRVRTNLTCTATLGGSTQPIESLRRSDVTIDPATPVIVEGDVTIELNFPVPTGDLTVGCTGTQADPAAALFTVNADGTIALPSTTPVISACTPSATTICVEGGRFSITVEATNTAGQTTQGRVNARDLYPDGGYFWFFNQDRPDIVVRIVNRCRQDNRYWVEFDAVTAALNAEFVAKVYDARVGVYQSYARAYNERVALTDTNGFATCP